MAERTAVALGAVAGTGLGIANAASVGLLSRRVDAIEAELFKLGITPGATMGIIEDIQKDVTTLKSKVSALELGLAQLTATVQADFQSLQTQITALVQTVNRLLERS